MVDGEPGSVLEQGSPTGVPGAGRAARHKEPLLPALQANRRRTLGSKFATEPVPPAICGFLTAIWRPKAPSWIRVTQGSGSDVA